MPSYLSLLAGRGLAHPPKWLPDNIQFETLMGSQAYGCNEDASDTDLYAWCIPPKEMTFPHLAGEIAGFGRQHKRFEQHQEHHIVDPTARAGKGATYDVQCYSVVKYFALCMENNPNMLDSLFTPRECVTHSNRVSEMVRERRRLFLHKGAWHKFRGYAYSQLAKISNQWTQVADIRQFEDHHGLGHDISRGVVEHEVLCRASGHANSDLLLCGLSAKDLQEYERLWRAGLEGGENGRGSKRFHGRKRFGYDVKFAMHLVRLIGECEQILTMGDIDLRRDSAMLRDVRAGNWTEQALREWFARREKELDPLYVNSTAVPYEPDEKAIKALLLEVLEEHYGSLSGCAVTEDRVLKALRDIRAILDGV